MPIKRRHSTIKLASPGINSRCSTFFTSNRGLSLFEVDAFAVAAAVAAGGSTSIGVDISANFVGSAQGYVIFRTRLTELGAKDLRLIHPPLHLHHHPAFHDINIIIIIIIITGHPCFICIYALNACKRQTIRHPRRIPQL